MEYVHNATFRRVRSHNVSSSPAEIRLQMASTVFCTGNQLHEHRFRKVGSNHAQLLDSTKMPHTIKNQGLIFCHGGTTIKTLLVSKTFIQKHWRRSRADAHWTNSSAVLVCIETRDD